MKDLEILQSLLNGNHLNNNEMERAAKLLYLLDIEIKQILKGENK